MIQLYREITPINKHDCFTFFSRNKTAFNFPLHTHDEFELIMILNAAGAKRFVGDHTEKIENFELVLIGSNLPHTWQNHTYEWKDGHPKIEEICIQFHNDLLDEKLLARNQMLGIKNLLENSQKGILFNDENKNEFKELMVSITQKKGFESFVLLLTLLHKLANSKKQRQLSNAGFVTTLANTKSRRLQKVFDYMNLHFANDISLDEIAKIAGMASASFSRFIKKRTGKTFVDSLNEIRLGHCTRHLIDSTESIAEIAYSCGYNNLSYFNRVFKEKNGCTPKVFRETYTGERVFV